MEKVFILQLVVAAANGGQCVTPVKVFTNEDAAKKGERELQNALNVAWDATLVAKTPNGPLMLGKLGELFANIGLAGLGTVIFITNAHESTLVVPKIVLPGN
jgi:hypothetical protein